ncbi:N-acetylmuramoyl-L-alanine amidase [Ectothiorhodospira lacustris]|uniref:N-acetylmuramoyl-L-alanine amidase n=1 Tax=Ectothiorhodospira lacustris TaxID=2899127 RepID=UPI001EE9ADFE|nr:N-acetylmuramoyl-L-alanine amidase [Ectothiorhodospira lacustris]MCG5522641.1 N-acetylmuramoyl-L-alanine amidase [Ectothiorhodospira lacustris]
MTDDGYQARRRQFLRSLLFASGATAVGLWWPAVVSASGQAAVRGLRTSVDGEVTRLVFELSGPVDHAVFTLSNPDRVVLDLRKARAAVDLRAANHAQGPLRSVRHAPRNEQDLRVVLDLRHPVNPRTFLLRPADGAGHRLVIDLQGEGGSEPVATQAPREVIRSRDVIVAIDAGHGGKDPGAIGPAGTYEKDVVLAIARRLETLVQREPGMTPVMIRTGDYFLPLRERINRARQQHADVFISIHADAAPNAQVQGSSVYMLSDRGATSEAARWLAQRENEADRRLGAVPINDKDDVLASVLLDLTQNGTLEASKTLADTMIGELHRVGKVRSPRVERAGFAVLRSPDVPSVLVEAAFISNPAEERKLRTSAFQQSMAEALLGGLRAFFDGHAPPGTLLAEQRRGRHVIQRGETLSGIATRYQVPVSQLRTHNNLSSDVIRVGQVLEIPMRDS